MRSGPSEQFRPTESGLTCSTAFQKASVVWAEIKVSPPRPTAAEIITGNLTWSSSKTSRMATRAALAFSESKMVSTRSRSDPAGDQGADFVLVGGFDLVEGDDAEAGVIRIGRIGEGDGQGSDGSGYEALAAGFVGDAVGPLTALPGGFFVDLPGQAVEERVVDDLLVEGGVFAAAVLAGVFDEEFALGDAGGSKGVGLDDVCPGFEEAAVNVADHVRLGQGEEVSVVQQVFFRVLKAVATDVGFLHAVGADGGAHRSVDDGDSGFQDFL